MIVVATHNSSINLDRLLASMRAHGTDGKKVLLVASGSPAFFEYVEMTAKVETQLKLDWVINPCDSFETGAWVTAYRHYPNDSYLFIQDSMEVTGAGWYQQFEIRHAQASMEGLDAVIPWVTFTPYLLGVTPEVRQRITEIYGLMGEPGFGIFGSMFYASSAVLRKVEDAGYLNYLPKDKIDSEAFERWWALFFHRLQIPMFALHADGYGALHRTGEAFPLLRKHFHSRNGGQR
jgi:hypothetical protein